MAINTRQVSSITPSFLHLVIHHHILHLILLLLQLLQLPLIMVVTLLQVGRILRLHHLLRVVVTTIILLQEVIHLRPQCKQHNLQVIQLLRLLIQQMPL